MMIFTLVTIVSSILRQSLAGKNSVKQNKDLIIFLHKWGKVFS